MNRIESLYIKRSEYWIFGDIFKKVEWVGTTTSVTGGDRIKTKFIDQILIIFTTNSYEERG